jgi:hypothetical protein
MTHPASRAASGRTAGERKGGGVRRAWLLPIWLAIALPALAATAPPGAGAGALWAASSLQPHEVPATNAERGFAVALDGNRAAVGARFDGSTGAGRVYVFSWDGSGWKPEAVLEGAQPGDQFGISVALHGDTLAVGAVGEERDQQLPTGKVHVFVRTCVDGSEHWCEQLCVVGLP